MNGRFGTCRSCGARLLWAMTGAGRSMPINVQPARDGNLRLHWAKGAAYPTVEVLARDRLAEARRVGEPLRLSHYATCPDAANYRQRQTSRT